MNDEVLRTQTRLMTHRELARWCAEGKGEYMYEGYSTIRNTFVYAKEKEDMPVLDDILIRSWGEIEWHKPLIEV